MIKTLTATRYWWIMGVLLLALVASGGILLVQGQSAEADGPHCGATLGAGNHQLLHNLGPCPAALFGLRLTNGAHLDMSGFTVSCPVGVTFCIQIVGTGAHLNGGTVEGGGDTGILVAGGGSHHVNGMNVSGSLHGIRLIDGSIGNHINGNNSNNNDVGIEVDNGSLNNKLNGNTTVSNDFSDLLDFNRNCDNNKWISNVFNTRNQNCIN